MKKYVYSLLFLIPLTSHIGYAQSLSAETISKDLNCEHTITFLQFNGKSNKKLLHTLNEEFGYDNTLYKTIGIYEIKNKTSEEMCKKICAILNEEEDGILSDIHYELSYKNERLINIYEVIIPEGLHRGSNSLVADIPIIYSHVYDLKNNKKITSLSELFTEEGSSYLHKTAKKILDERSKRLSHEDPKNYECRFSDEQNLSYYLNLVYTITNTTVTTDSVLYFYFNETGLIIDSNLSPCWKPTMQITFPYHEIALFYKDKGYLPDLKKIKREYTVKANKVSLLDEPTDYSKAKEIKKPYLVKGDHVTVLGESEKTLKIKYISPNNQEIIGWIGRENLE